MSGLNQIQYAEYFEDLHSAFERHMPDFETQNRRELQYLTYAPVPVLHYNTTWWTVAINYLRNRHPSNFLFSLQQISKRVFCVWKECLILHAFCQSLFSPSIPEGLGLFSFGPSQTQQLLTLIPVNCYNNDPSGFGHKSSNKHERRRKQLRRWL